MTRSKKLGKSLRSVSPVSPTQTDLDAALDVLNNSLDSRLFAEVTGSRFEIGNDDATVRMSEPSPTLVTDEKFDKDTSVLIKCQTLIDELQVELDAQRKRNNALDTELEKTRAEYEAFKLSSSSKQSVDSLEKEINSLKQQLADANQLAKKKDVELENMTRHCERRLDEMKRQLKQHTSVPNAVVTSVSTMDVASQEELKHLRMKLKMTEKKLSSQGDEMKSVADSYERQLRALRSQLDESQTFFKNYYGAKAKAVDSASTQRSNPFRDY